MEATGQINSAADAHRSKEKVPGRRIEIMHSGKTVTRLLASAESMEAEAPAVAASLRILAEAVSQELELEALGMLAAFPDHFQSVMENVLPRLSGDTSKAAERKAFEARRVALREAAKGEMVRLKSHG
jgi:hypothetical protein